MVSICVTVVEVYTSLSLIATADLISQAQFALDIKRQVLPLYEEVFDIEYPLPKLDTLIVSPFHSKRSKIVALTLRVIGYRLRFRSNGELGRWSTREKHGGNDPNVQTQGLITGRTQAFLLDPTSADVHFKQYVASTQSHEVAHMWYVALTI